jgi:diadenosine tetraphosphate (Ap4A) HIT family hydrolase
MLEEKKQEGCVFCYPTVEVLYEGVDWNIIEDLYKKETEKFHYLIISKKHKVSIFDMEFHTSIELMSLIHKLSKEHTKTFFLKRNEGGYQQVPHIHWHFVSEYTVKK